MSVEAGSYRLRRRAAEAVFAQSVGPQSWKTFLHPPRERVWSAQRDGCPRPDWRLHRRRRLHCDGFTVDVEDAPTPR